jgi:hypothetical protein
MGDKSSAACPTSQVKPPAPYLPPPQQEEGEDQTGMFSDMLAEFKQNLGEDPHRLLQETLQASYLDPREREQEDPGQGSMSMIAPPARAEPFNLTATGGGGCRLDNTGLSQTASGVRDGGLDLTGAATPRLQLTAASGFRPTPRLDQTTAGAKPGLNLTGAAATPGLLGRSGCAAPPGLDLTGMTAGGPGRAAPLGLNLTGATTPGVGRAAAIGLNLTGATTALDVTGGAAVPSLNLSIADAAWQNASSGVAAKRPGLDLTGGSSDFPAVPMPPPQENTWADDCDPFSPALHARLMSGLARPAHSRHGYVRCAGRLPAVREGAMLQLGGADRFFVSCLKGEGGFARVYAATKEEEEGLDSTIAGIDAVLKVLKRECCSQCCGSMTFWGGAGSGSADPCL